MNQGPTDQQICSPGLTSANTYISWQLFLCRKHFPVLGLDAVSISAECRGATLVRCQRFLAGCGRSEYTVYSVHCVWGREKIEVVLEQHRWDFLTVLPINSSYIKFYEVSRTAKEIFPFSEHRWKSLTTWIIWTKQVPLFIGIHVAWLARLIKPYYPGCLIATVCVPLPHPPLTAGRDVYPGNHWQQVERRRA